MTGTDATRWHPGDHLAAVWPHGLALLDGSVLWPDAERIWTSMSREGSLGTFLELLAESTGKGLLALPPFAVVLFDAGRCHLAVRGHFIVETGTGEVSTTYSSEGITTWLEKKFPAPEVLVLRSAGADGEGLPLREGLILAGALSVGLPLPADTPTPGPASVAETPEPQPAAEHLSTPEPAGASDPQAFAEPPETQADPQPAAEPGGHRAARLLETALPVGAEEAVAPDIAAPAGPGGAGRYASLLAESIVVRPEDAAVRPDEPMADKARDADDDEGLHDGHTIFAADESLIAFKVPSSPSAPMVLAAFCSRGHVNPPQRSECRVCHTPVDPRTERTPRPALGRLRTSSGEVVDLVGRLIAGRSPSRGKDGDPTVRLVPLPHAHVSGNHLEITLEEWTVLARDLNSTNGTYLHRRGQPVVRLPENPIPLADGDVLDLGHGVSLSLEQLP